MLYNVILVSAVQQCESAMSMKVKVLVVQSCLTLCDPVDCSLPGSSIHGISRRGYWNGLPFPSLGDVPLPGIELAFPVSPALQVDSLLPEPSGKPLTYL